MWFLGAGTSRSAGLPTATDVIWDLKQKHYCLHQNQDMQSHDINHGAIKNKIQTYMDSQGYPPQGSPEEYSFYFDLMFGADDKAQQQYIQRIFSNDKVSLNIGHRVLAAMMEMGHAKIVYTTNFDEVIEMAFAAVVGKSLSTYHLEGSYAAIDALNAERFPIYAKIHGDFRYRKMKNLAIDSRNNDQEVHKCFLAGATRYGLVVSGYSGRDNNVMSMFRDALDQNNAFPHGLYWTVPRIREVEQNVIKLLEYSKAKGVSVHLIEVGTFDEMLSKIWRQTEIKPPELAGRVRTARVEAVAIQIPPPGNQYPILRTNAVPVCALPANCGMVDLDGPLTYGDLKKKVVENKPNAILTYTDKILFWGNKEDVVKVLTPDKIKSIMPFSFHDCVQGSLESTFMKSFFEEALAKALCHGKPLYLCRNRRTYHAVVKYDATDDPSFTALRNALNYKGKPGYIAGKVSGLEDVAWAESVSIRLEERNGQHWCMLRPNIWISPLARRQEAQNFLRKRRLYRYNTQSYFILDAWIGILVGSVGARNTVKVTCFPDEEYMADFELGTRTGYSRRGGNVNV